MDLDLEAFRRSKISLFNCPQTSDLYEPVHVSDNHTFQTFTCLHMMSELDRYRYLGDVFIIIENYVVLCLASYVRSMAMCENTALDTEPRLVERLSEVFSKPVRPCVQCFCSQRMKTLRDIVSNTLFAFSYLRKESCQQFLEHCKQELMKHACHPRRLSQIVDYDSLHLLGFD